MNDSESQREWVLAALEQFEGRLVRYATRLLGDEHAARDAVQHAFLRLCHTSEEEVGARLAAWLFTVCRNRVLDSLRRAGREAPFASLEQEDEQGPLRDGPAWDHDPAALVERQELHARIRQAVEELTATQREVVWLYADGFTYREIASITDRTDGSVRVLVHRAITRLRVHPRLQYLYEDRRRVKVAK
jgi:RNA polymerase sigma-70 factor (ECF subfamily)